jgi:F0F1-type ATP synthase membrane subunit c/vacuolar-type H+-ATPase subunit K
MAIMPHPVRGSLVQTLRLIVLSAIGSLAAFFAVLVAMGLPFDRPDTLWLALPMVLGFADLVLVPAVGSTVRPLPYGVGEADARRISANVLRTVTFLRFALAEAPALFGLIASFLAHSAVPYAIGFAFSVPLMLLYAYPRTAVVDAVRARLEAGGVPSHIWAAISGGR